VRRRPGLQRRPCAERFEGTLDSACHGLRVSILMTVRVVSYHEPRVIVVLTIRKHDSFSRLLDWGFTGT
jgi:hypothetical protein